MIGLILGSAMIFPCYGLTLQESLLRIVNDSNIDVFLEEGLENDPGIPLPMDKSTCDISVILEHSLKNYSYAVLYEGPSIRRIWIRKDGKKSTVKISNPHPIDPVHNSPEQEEAYIVGETRNDSSLKILGKTFKNSFLSRDSAGDSLEHDRRKNPWKALFP
ncbi:MAG: hypothetical protein JW920_10540 [Deltaproteobacteria bacterium]|nr:hypothetical protein [Deltaproteobacteria bacterium]